jgi:hypothetical protein
MTIKNLPDEDQERINDQEQKDAAARAEDMRERFDEILAERCADELDALDMDERYKNMLDDCCEPCKVGYITFDPSRVLEELDPIAYSCGFNDYVGNEESEGVVEEIDGEYYDAGEVQGIRDEIEDEIAELEEAAEEEEDPDE